MIGKRDMELARAKRCYAQVKASGYVCGGCSWQYDCGLFDANRLHQPEVVEINLELDKPTIMEVAK